MKHLLTTIMLTACLPCLADDWTGPDKTKHVAVSAAIASTVTMATGSENTGFAVALGVGLAKEVWDSKHAGHEASIKDLAADALGAYVGSKFGGWMIAKTGGKTVIMKQIQF